MQAKFLAALVLTATAFTAATPSYAVEQNEEQPGAPSSLSTTIPQEFSTTSASLPIAIATPLPYNPAEAMVSEPEETSPQQPLSTNRALDASKPILNKELTISEAEHRRIVDEALAKQRDEFEAKRQSDNEALARQQAADQAQRLQQRAPSPPRIKATIGGRVYKLGLSGFSAKRRS